MGYAANIEEEAPRTLSAEELEWMRDWRELGFLELDIHAELEHQIRVCMNGDESAIIVGDGGVGKTRSVQLLCDRVEQEEMERAVSKGGPCQPRRILRYTSSRAQGPKTALLDLWTRAVGGAPSTGMQKRSTAHQIIEEIVKTLSMGNFALIVVDEAQMISPDNLDLLRQVPDAAKTRGYRLGLMLVGSPALRASLVEVRHLGQRFSAELNLQPLNYAQWAEHANQFHPHLEELRAALPLVEWKALLSEIWARTNGSFRRIERVLLNANTLALTWNQPIDLQILRFSLDKLAPEA